MRYFGTILFFIFSLNTLGQTKIVCGGKQTIINDKTSFVSTNRPIQSYVLNDRAVHLPFPNYPSDYLSKVRELTGSVSIIATIDENGNVISANASGKESLKNLAIEAIWKAKFKKRIVNCQPQRYTGSVIYNFSEVNFQRKIADDDIVSPLIGDFEKEFAKDLVKKWKVKSSSFEILNGKGIAFQSPTCPTEIKSCGGFVKVIVLLDENRKVLKAEPISGDSRLFEAAVSTITGQNYMQPIPEKTKTIGFYVYNFDFARKPDKTYPISIFNGGVINGRATYLPKPVLPPDVEITGAVNIRVTVDEEGNVISADALSGDDIIKTFALKSAWKAKFKPTYLSGKPVKVNNAVIVYNFPPKQIQ